MTKRYYRVELESEYWSDFVMENYEKYDKGFKTLKEAKNYVKSIAKELKEILHNGEYINDLKNNTLCIDILRYDFDVDNYDEEPYGVVYTKYLCGRY